MAVYHASLHMYLRFGYTIYRLNPIAKAVAKPTTEVKAIVFTPKIPAPLPLSPPSSPEDEELEALSVPLPSCCLIIT